MSGAQSLPQIQRGSNQLKELILSEPIIPLVPFRFARTRDTNSIKRVLPFAKLFLPPRFSMAPLEEVAFSSERFRPLTQE
jgi:hypothetical protein